MTEQAALFAAPGDRDERVQRMQDGARRKREAIARARAALAEARRPYDEAASELLGLMERGAPKAEEHAARLRMWAAYPPVAAARRALREVEGGGR